MYCPHCGSDTDGVTCPECGASRTVLSRARPFGTTGLTLSGWWRRVIGTIVDAIVFIVVAFVLSLFATHNESELIAGVLAIAYFIVLVQRPAGQTIGNVAAATRVRSARTAGTVSLRQSTIRWACQILPFWLGLYLHSPGIQIAVDLYIILDILFPLFDVRNQTLHDKAASTVVVLTSQPV